jgi:hypothetical protein
MKYLTLIVLFILVSCGNKEDILLPKSNTTIVKNVIDHSPIYIFFRTKAKDTLAEVNRKNEIISTNWIFNIDKRLPLRLVIPEVIKLQNKKREEKAHKNEKALNYYSYADTIGKNLAFIPFTNVYYKMEKPKSGIVVLFTKKNKILVNNIAVKKEELLEYLNKLPSAKTNKYVFCFDKNLSFGSYIQNKIFIKKIESKEVIVSEEFIF